MDGLPRQVALKAFVGRREFPGAWFLLWFPTSKNPIPIVVGPANACGELVVEQADLLAGIQRTVSAGIMDYGSWSGEIFVEVVDAEAVSRLRRGYERWSSAVSFPDDYLDQLERLEIALAAQGYGVPRVIASTPLGEAPIRAMRAGTFDQTPAVRGVLSPPLPAARADLNRHPTSLDRGAAASRAPDSSADGRGKDGSPSSAAT